MNEQEFRRFESIFYPESIAVVGASGDERKMGTVFLRDLMCSDYKGKLYAVDHIGGTFLDLEIYTNLRDIPDTVEYVIVAIPRDGVLDLLDDCGAKKVKAVHFFTAGFSESGEEEGSKLEEEMVKKARNYGFRIIGPNSIGVYSSEANMLANGGAADFGEVGSASLISQSGSVVQKVVQNGTAFGLCFNKMVSIGNACDLDSTDFLEYFTVDSETEVIGAYLEGVKDGRCFFQAVKEVSKRKPVVVWKGGKTLAGAKAAASHTGALTVPTSIWSAMLKQSGAIEVESLGELVDTMLAFQKLPLLEGRGIAIVSGMLDGGGGESVSATDACIGSGLDVPLFDEWTVKQLEFLLGRVGSILHNPLDVSQSQGNMETIHRAVEIASADQYIDLVIIQERIDLLLRLASGELVETMTSMFLDLKRKQIKPLVVVLERGLAEAEWVAAVGKLSNAQIPVFSSLERAAKAVANLCRYSDYRRTITTDI
jgi:acyl-CoA synthetase (NDP forming)